MRWRTALPSAYLRSFRVEQAHTAVFCHCDDPGGSRFTVGIMVPECT